MNIINNIISLVRREGRMGQHLRRYEEARYTNEDRQGEQRIIVPPDADQFADVSFWQGLMNWAKYILNSFYAIIRISQNTWIDKEFENNYVNGHNEGVQQGGYIFYDDRVSPQAQANTALAALNGRALEGHLVVDWEVNYGGAYFGLKHVIELIKLLKASGVRCYGYLIYTGYYFFIENSNAVTNSAEYKYITDNNIGLWIAWYANASIVKIPEPWTTWTYWQYGTPAVGLEWGAQSTKIDMNYSNGTLDFGGTPPTGDAKMYECISDVSIRNEPDYYGGDKIDVLYVGDRVSAVIVETPSDPVPRWLKFTEIKRKNGTIKTFAYPVFCSAHPKYTVEIAEPPSGGSKVTRIVKNESFDIYYEDGSIETWRADDVEFVKDS